MHVHIFALELIAYLLIGVLAGVSSGLLGISGGLIVIPFFLLIFHHFGISGSMVAHAAIATSLAAMTFNTISSTISHNKRRGIIWRTTFWMLPGLILGALVGAFIANLLPSIVLRILFGIFECGVGAYFIHSSRRERRNKKPLELSSYSLAGLGFLISSISAIFGIGGGPITVPVLYYLVGLPLKKAIGTSAANGFFITFFGALSYLILGLGQADHPNMLGYIYLPAFFVTSITSLFFAPLGARLAHKLEEKNLKKAFGIGLILLGIIVLISSF